MRKFLYICLAVVGLGLFCGCKSQKAAVVGFSDLNGEWGVVELNGKTLNPQDTHQVLVLDMAKNRISGNAGCNRLTGGVEYSEAQKHIVKFPRIATTRMACQDMAGEQELLGALDKVVRFAAEGKGKPSATIAFYGMDNSKLLVIEKQK